MRKHLYQLTKTGTTEVGDVKLMTQTQAEAANTLQVQGNPWIWILLDGATFKRLQTFGV